MRFRKPTTVAPSSIVIIEDDIPLSNLIRKRLSSTDLSIVILTTAEDVIDYVKNNPDCLLLLNNKLSSMNAEQIIDMINEAGQAPPFIIITGHGDEKIAAQMMRRGAFDYIVKDELFLDLLPEVVQRTLDELTIQVRLVNAEEAIRKNEEQYRLLFESMTQGVLYIDWAGSVVSANPAAEKILGLSLHELKQRFNEKLNISFLNPEGIEMTFDEIPAIAALKSNVEAENVIMAVYNPKRSEYRWLRVDAIPQYKSGDSSPDMVYMIFEDITEARNAEETIRYQAGLIDEVSDAIISTDTDYVIKSWNNSAEKIYGWTAEETVGKNIGDFLKSSSADSGYDTAINELYSNDIWRGIVIHATKDGPQKTINSSINLIRDSNSIPTGTVAINSDWSELKKAQESHAFLASIIQSIKDAVIGKKLDGTIVSWNPGAERLYGYTLEEIIGKNVSILFPDELKNELPAILDTVEKGGIVNRMTTVRNRTDDSLLYLSITVSPIRNDRGIIGVATIARDITEQMCAEEQLQRAQRIDSLGTLAGGIAHDFNNMLSGIMGNLELFLMNSNPLPESQLEPLRDAFETCRLAAGTVKKIQSLSNHRMMHREIIDVAVSAKSVFDLLDRTTNRLVAKKMDIEQGRFFVNANPEQLGQVFLNLGTNAVQAIEDKGATDSDAIRVMGEFHDVPPNDTSGLSEGGYIHIAFSDTGTGMSKEIMDRAFDPLFTTRDRGTKKAQGLGLAMVYNIITNILGGAIFISSSPGRGTTFDMYLPAAKAHTEKAPPDDALPKTGVILVAEDEDAVRNFLVRALTHFGYNVITAVDGKEAIDRFTERSDDIDCIILDITMPKITGADVMKRMLEIDPGAKIILSSGQSVEKILQYEGALGVVSKPYRIEELLDTIAGVLKS